jgi:hypothetical protein
MLLAHVDGRPCVLGTAPEGEHPRTRRALETVRQPALAQAEPRAMMAKPHAKAAGEGLGKGKLEARS